MNIKDNLFHEIEHFYDLDPNFTMSNPFYKNLYFLNFHLVYSKLKHATMNLNIILIYSQINWYEMREEEILPQVVSKDFDFT